MSDPEGTIECFSAPSYPRGFIYLLILGHIYIIVSFPTRSKENLVVTSGTFFGNSVPYRFTFTSEPILC